MKKLIIASMLILSSSLTMAQNFSAFTSNGTLYVTVMGDSCNSLGGELSVSPLCRKGRLTTNYVHTCSADLIVMSTQMMCNNEDRKARVIEIDLESSGVTSEAQVLKLNHLGSTIKVNIE